MTPAVPTPVEARSLAERFARLPSGRRSAILGLLRPRDRAVLLYAWRFWARPTQVAPPDGEWGVLLWLAGRGWGKSKAGSEWVRERVDRREARSIGLIGPSLQDIRDTMLGEGRGERGEGLLNVWPPSQRPNWEPSKRRVTFWTGAVATIYTAEEPEMRGPNLDTIWADELAKWRYLEAIWGNLEMTLRKPGATPPRIAITTTPKPLALLRELVRDPWTRVVRGSTFDNASNLSPMFLDKMRRKYAGSRLGAQELYAEILDDNPDALFSQALIDARRLTPKVDADGAIVWPRLALVVVAIDPAATTGRSSDETGIVVCGVGYDGTLYVLEDLSEKLSPDAWATRVVEAVDRWSRRAEQVFVAAEVNYGGDLVATVLRSKRQTLTLALVRATHGKELRAEPVSALYAQGRVVHVGRFGELEQEMTEWNPATSSASPNRLDALAWAMFKLARLDEDTHEMSAESLPGPGHRLDPLAGSSRVADSVVAVDVGGGWVGGSVGGRFL